MGKKKDGREQKPTKPLNKFVFYGVIAVFVCAIGFFAPYSIICFLKNKGFVFDVEILKDKTLWVWFGIVVGVVIIGVIGFSIYYDLFNHTKLLNKNENAKSDLYGDSRFLTDKEIKEQFGDYNFNDLPNIETSGHLVRSQRSRGKLMVSVVPKQHALISGVSGDGKSLRHLGVTIQLNAKSKTKPSMLINDIKGELWNMHSKFLKEQGYETVLLDMRNPYTSARLNPLNIIWQLKKEAEETQTEMHASELEDLFYTYRIFKGLLNIDEFKKYLTSEELINSDKLYSEYRKGVSAVDLKDFPGALGKEPLKRFIPLPENFTGCSDTEQYAILYHLFIDKYKFFLKAAPGLDKDNLYQEWQRTQFNKKMSKLNRATALVVEMSRQIVPETTGENKQWSDGAQGICAAIILAMLEDGFSPELAFTEEMFSITQISNIVNRYRAELNDFFKLRDIESKVFDFAGMILDNPADKTVAGYMSNLQTPLKNYIEDGIEYLMSGTDVNFNDIVAKPTAIFILLPEEFPTRYPVANMIITQVYNELLFQANEFAEQNYLLPRPFYFLLDEFGNLPKIPDLSTWVTLSRSRNIYFAFYVQALSQINNIYGENNMKTIVQNCHLQIIMGSNEDESITHFQKLFGQRTVIKRTANFDPKTSDIDFKGSSSLEKADLVPESHLRKIPTGVIYWKLHKTNPARTNIELIFDNTDILSIGTYDKPAETMKPYNKNERIYDITARNKYVKELDGLLAAAEDDDSGEDGGASNSIPTGFVEVSPEELEKFNNENSNQDPNENKATINPHTKLLDF